MTKYAVGDTVQHHNGEVFVVRDTKQCPGDAEFHKHDVDTGLHDAVSVHDMFGPAWVCERRVTRLVVS